MQSRLLGRQQDPTRDPERREHLSDARMNQPWVFRAATLDFGASRSHVSPPSSRKQQRPTEPPPGASRFAPTRILMHDRFPTTQLLFSRLLHEALSFARPRANKYWLPALYIMYAYCSKIDLEQMMETVAVGCHLPGNQEQEMPPATLSAAFMDLSLSLPPSTWIPNYSPPPFFCPFLPSLVFSSGSFLVRSSTCGFLTRRSLGCREPEIWLLLLLLSVKFNNPR